MATAAANIGGSIISGLFAKKAAKQQISAQEQAIAAQQDVPLGSSRSQSARNVGQLGLLQPFVDFGASRLNPLGQFVDQGADFSQTQAFKDIVNTQKAGGQSLSGNTLTALTDFYATNFRPQRFNELFQTANLGLGAAASLNTGTSSASATGSGVGLAANIGGLQQNIGAFRAGSTAAQGQALASGFGSFLELFKKRPGD